ncbi:glycoside hydrolase family 31 protein [Curtobacterium sp. MCBD17_028]|uniref:glycoside hydrolase family 31 protein n=1 Tax=Curtobacterium sp. MCBD17_028 TaxID=2175670 RepID=UPI000DA9C5DA|nr:glycoside hydrolase family 31 protein [Curtobacterium sp. MCBD17_028]PZE23544.1 glycoside hydrolase [Curtobacterium sp. MCBD17_028]
MSDSVTQPTPDATPTALPVIRPLPGAAPRARDDQQVHGDGWRITVLTEGLFRVERSADGGFEDRASTFAIRRDLPAVPFDVERSGRGVVVTTARARLRYDGGPFSASGLLVEMIGADTGRWRYGEPTRDLGGTARTLDDVDGRTDLEPGVVAPDGIAVVDDAASFLFEDDGWVGVRGADREDLYVFAYGRDYPAAVSALYAVSGPPTRLPRWALGNWWSRYHPYTADSYLALMDRFDDEGVPFSVAVIDMDWHRVDSVPSRFGNGWTGYSWERSLFPDPEGFLTALHERGMRTTLNLHPADGVRAFEDAYPTMARALGVDPETERPLPFAPTDRAFLESYFRDLHDPLEDQGVDFWWIDWQQGRTSDLPGVDPLWVLNHFHHLDAARNGGPGMTFSRYAGPGSHRYAVGFSGDAVVSWASLAFQPEFTATAANIGYAWWSHDIGGHTRGVRDDELATRWVQFGVFSPIMRLHSANNPFIRKEPWSFPPEHRAAMDDALRFRHRMVPYLHTMNHAAAAGTPLVRPMYHLEPRRSEAYRVPNEYAFGSELLVAPITEPRDPASLLGSVRAWLPAGTWTDVFTGTVYRGDRSLAFHRPTASIPVLLRAGGILPLDAGPDLDATRNPSELEVLVAPAASGTFVLAEDAEDDDAGAAAAGPAVRTELAWDLPTRTFRIGPAEGRGDLVPPVRTWTLTVLAALPDGPVTVDGAEVAVTGVDGRWSVTATVPSDVGAVVRIAGEVRVGPDRRAAARTVLADAQMGNPEKLEAWEIIAGDRPVVDRLAELDAVALPQAVRAALTELLGAVVGEVPPGDVS